MAKSLQDQLLKAGLVATHKAKQIKHEKHKQAKQSPQAQHDDELKRLAQQAQTEKAQRDRESNRQQQQEAEHKAIAAQIKQLIAQHRLDYTNGEIVYQFADLNKIKKLYITEKQREQLARGLIAIVKHESRYELVPAAVAEKIRQRDADAVLVLLSTQAVQDTSEEAYAAYQIPDDLIW